MADPVALQEAIQRARQLAAKMAQGAPAKRPASELEDNRIGTVKVTLAYDPNSKPKTNNDANAESAAVKRPRLLPESPDSQSRSSNQSMKRDNHYNNNNDNSSNNNIINHSNSLLPSTRNHSSEPISKGASTDKLELIIPHAVIGLVIGKGGENIKRIQNESGASVRVDPNTIDEKGNKLCTITGSKQAVEDAHAQVTQVIESAATSKRPERRGGQYEGGEVYKMKIPASRTGAIIGKGGDTIKHIKQQSGCEIELDKHAKECAPDESLFIIRGTQEKIQKARSMIEARLSSRGRDHDHSGGGGGGGSGRSGGKVSGVATGANAAPLASYPETAANPYAAASAAPQPSADVSAAWAAYFAQYSTVYNQPGAQPGTPNMAYAGQTLLGSTNTSQTDPNIPHQQHVAPGTPQAPQMTATSQNPQQTQQDFSDEWIRFYIMNGRPDYAEQIREMKMQQQAQSQLTPQP